tara:strand:- start:52610 stop:52975 length:366 start_codon:yes stop_codon:yes gene_type:complete
LLRIATATAAKEECQGEKSCAAQGTSGSARDRTTRTCLSGARIAFALCIRIALDFNIKEIAQGFDTRIQITFYIDVLAIAKQRTFAGFAIRDATALQVCRAIDVACAAATRLAVKRRFRRA